MMTTTNNQCRNEGKGFTFIWKIDNFSHCSTETGTSVSSPSFKIRNTKGSYTLKIHPRGNVDNHVECFLMRSYEKTAVACFTLQFCVCVINGEVLCEAVKENLLSYSSGSHCIAKFERSILEALPEDTLVIHCHVLENSSGITKHCFANTRINLQRRIFYWSVEKFSLLKLREEKVFNLSEVKEDRISLSLMLSLVGRNLEDATIQITLSFKKVTSKTFSTCNIFLMEENGKAKKYMQDEYWLESGDSFKTFPHFLTRRELITSDLPNDTLLLKGQVTLNGENDGLEQVVYGLTTQAAVGEAFGSTSRPSLEHVPSALSADMLALFDGSGPPSDFELRVEGRSFPVHQLVLGTRSVVFRAMFDNDMLEQSTKSVELTDLDADTAERLLKFAYADVEPPAGIAWEPLASLYSAADKYQILALRKICARRLVEILDSSNAPRILQLADRHRDSHLKGDVVDFIFKRGRAVLESDQWETLQRDDPNLVTETLQKIFCEKVLIQPLDTE